MNRSVHIHVSLSQWNQSGQKWKYICHRNIWYEKYIITCPVWNLALAANSITYSAKVRRVAIKTTAFEPIHCNPRRSQSSLAKPRAQQNRVHISWDVLYSYLTRRVWNEHRLLSLFPTKIGGPYLYIVAGKRPFGWRMQYLSNITTLVKHETSDAVVMCCVQTIAAGRQFPSYSCIVIFKTSCSVRINQDETQ